ncbi:MAG TPA: hypothetical protein PKA10_18775 [Selenomonadales bacterium]|nr:hypothetical protein [Selenomonadales bacterium]
MDRLYDRKIYAARLPMEDLLFWAANVEIIPNLRGIMTAEELAPEIRKLLLVEGNMSETRAAKLAGMSQQNLMKN